MFYAVLLAFLAALSMERSDPARAARDSWWPAQRAPRGFVTVRVQGVPTPKANVFTVDMREEMLSASLAGLAALAVNCGEADELVWNDTVVQRYGEWKARTVARLGLEDRGTFTPWELLERGMRAGWVRGYVAYARDPSGRKAYTAKNASTNESVNVATSLAGIHRAVLIEESLISRAEALACACWRMGACRCHQQMQRNFHAARCPCSTPACSATATLPFRSDVGWATAPVHRRGQ